MKEERSLETKIEICKDLLIAYEGKIDLYLTCVDEALSNKGDLKTAKIYLDKSVKIIDKAIYVYQQLEDYKKEQEKLEKYEGEL